MLVACWSAKGGVGTTVVATALAVVLARSSPSGAVLADLGGDAPAVLGLADPGDPGLAGWLAAGPGVPADALTRLELDVGNGLSLLPSGSAPIVGPSDRADVLAGLLAADPRPVVVDCGRLDRSEVGVVGDQRKSRSGISESRGVGVGFLLAMRLSAPPVGVGRGGGQGLVFP